MEIDKLNWEINHNLLNSALPENKQIALEIGVFRGHTTRKLAQIFQQVVCIDPLSDTYLVDDPKFVTITPTHYWKNQYEYFLKNTQHLSKQIKLYRDVSKNILPILDMSPSK